MKTLAAFLTFGFFLVLSQTSFGIGLGDVTKEATKSNSAASKVDTIAKDVGKMAIVDDTNKKLAGKAGGCTCDAKTGRVAEGCDYNGIGKIVNNAKTALQVALDRNAELNVTAAHWDCASTIQSSVSGWTWWRTHQNPSLGSTVVLKVQ